MIISKNSKWRFFALVFTFQQTTCSLGLPFIFSWSRSKRLTFDEFMGRLLSNLVHMPNMDILFLAHNSAVFCSIWMEFMHEFRIPLATIRALKTLLLGMLRRFGIIEPKLDQIWAWLYRNPSKVRSLVLVCWAAAISKTSSTKNQGEPPPSPPNLSS